MREHSVIKGIAIDQDEVLGELEQLAGDGVDDKELPTLLFGLRVLRNRTGQLHDHAECQKRATHMFTFGSDSAAQRRGLVDWDEDKAA